MPYNVLFFYTLEWWKRGGRWEAGSGKWEISI